MDQLDKIFSALQMHNWYAAAALILMILLQAIRQGNIPVLTKLWYSVPNGWRWIGPVFVGAATGFTTAFAAGASLSAALVAAIGGAIGIGTVAMGLHAGAKESPLHVDGGAGGSPLPPKSS